MKSEKKQIPKRNYVILAIISIVTIILVFYLENLYKQYLEYSNQRSNVMKFLQEIKKEEFDNYILDSHDAIIYLSSSTAVSDKKFEYNLKRYIEKKNLTKDIIYLDASDLDEKFYNNLEEKYYTKALQNRDVENNVIPNIMIIKNKKIIKILYKETPNRLDIATAKKFINKYWIEE